MKIILLKDVKSQGKADQILEVKDGFGTFLISKGDAVLATTNSLNRLQKENKEKENKEKEFIKECEIKKEELEKIKMLFKVKVGERDKVFGSISAKQIIDELKKFGYSIDKKQVKIDSQISTLGTHNVKIELHKKVNVNLKIELIK